MGWDDLIRWMGRDGMIILESDLSSSLPLAGRREGDTKRNSSGGNSDSSGNNPSCLVVFAARSFFFLSYQNFLLPFLGRVVFGGMA